MPPKSQTLFGDIAQRGFPTMRPFFQLYFTNPEKRDMIYIYYDFTRSNLWNAGIG